MTLDDLILDQGLPEQMERVSRIVSTFDWALDIISQQTILTLRANDYDPAMAPAVEFAMMRWQAFLRRFGPCHWRLEFVDFRHADSPRAEQLAEVFGVRPNFNAGLDRLGFRTARREAPARRMGEVCGRVAQGGGTEPELQTTQENVATRAVRLLRAGPNPGIARVAERLGLTPRTLQRRLNDEGTSYSELVRHVQRRMAERLLSTPCRSITETSRTLGFSDVPSFCRAFSRWTGLTPSEFRARQASPLRSVETAGFAQSEQIGRITLVAGIDHHVDNCMSARLHGGLDVCTASRGDDDEAIGAGWQPV
jgi:AraC-like DNA-binding protein